ncbi:uncharacterized protein LOC117145148 [Drosophila mauritiana]|uniref:Uncharacterized protein LOC117145148 n=1 Tax=Drosophila mauritiana TaxID=7226 RepID=A0A6P8KRK1_DROMA|nr:uncharacterized protein LOC117145148 [Drosophila mauritiana]
MCKSAIICLAIVACISQALAQTQTPQTCAQATGISFSQTAFSGQWVELARNPASNVSCISLNVAFWNNNSNMLVNISHSSNAASTLVDVYETANITLVENNLSGYNVTLVNGQKQEYVFVKLLSYVSSTYLVGCSYTDASNASTSAGFILGRSNYTLEGVKIANNDASVSFSNFQNNTYGNVTQFDCRASSAGQTVPLTLISGFLAFALLLIKA